MKLSPLALILAGLASLGPFSVDTYFPAFAVIAEAYGVTSEQMQQTLSFYLLALSVMMLFHGALADAFGRRKVVIISLAAYIISALGCAFAPSFNALLIFRVVMGLSAGAGVIVGRAIIRDKFHGTEAHQLMAQVTMLFGLAPAVAPILGGYLQLALGWRAIFVFLLLLAVLLLGSSLRYLPETLTPETRSPFRPLPLLKNYLMLLRNLRFIALIMSLGLAFGGFLVYVGGAADFVMHVLKLSETSFAWLFMPFVIGLVGGSYLVQLAVKRMSAERTANLGILLMFIGAAFNLAYHLFFAPRVPWSVMPLTFYALGASFQSPVVTLYALDMFPKNRGLAASLQGFFQTMLFALISSFVVPHITGSALGYALVMMACFVLNFFLWQVGKRAQPAEIVHAAG